VWEILVERDNTLFWFVKIVEHSLYILSSLTGGRRVERNKTTAKSGVSEVSRKNKKGECYHPR
jgi:hypothetical protein